MKKYVFRKYTQKYLEFFSLEKKRIVNALGFTVKIEHVGSTVIAGLGGKGIVDIVVGVSKAKLQEAKKKLEKAGYEFREIEQIGRYCRSKPVQRENGNFKRFVLESEFDQERFAKIITTIRRSFHSFSKYL